MKLKLQRNYYPECIINHVIDFFISCGYLNDQRYAETYIRSCSLEKSRLRILAELKNKGISEEIIGKAYENAEAEGFIFDEEKQIQDIIEKKHFSVNAAEMKDLRKMFGYLSRRGFSQEKIYKALFINT